MSQAWSISLRQPYGLQRVCRVWGTARSTVYFQRARRILKHVSRPRGPKPPISDEKILSLAKEYFYQTPWKEEGHRKIYAWIKFVQGFKVGKDRVLRVLKANQLLSPQRRPQGKVKAHDGCITTDKPDVLWATDGLRVRTLEEGWIWGFLAVDHHHGEILGVHSAKKGNTFAALQPISMGLMRIRSGVSKGVGQGISLRCDHGSQYISNMFTEQINDWGMNVSMAFVQEPQTNGVAERAVRTLKEQIVYGRVIRNAEDLRQKMIDYMNLYNSTWRLEKNRYRTPNEVRQQLALKQAA